MYFVSTYQDPYRQLNWKKS